VLTEDKCVILVGEMCMDNGHSSLQPFKSRRTVTTGRSSRYYAARLSRNNGDRLPRSSVEHHGVRSIIRCPICSKLFNNSSALAKHKLTHSDERKYTCSKCSKAFKRQDHLLVIFHFSISLLLLPFCSIQLLVCNM